MKKTNRLEIIRDADSPRFVFDPEKVPAELRHLIPWAKQWSISDDCIRAEVMEQTPRAELQAFVDDALPFVKPLFSWVRKQMKKSRATPEAELFSMFWDSLPEAQSQLETLAAEEAARKESRAAKGPRRKIEKPLPYADAEGVVIDETKIPQAIRHLTPLAKRWSIGDDRLRLEMIAAISEKERLAFIAAVDPHLEEIHQWTKAFDKKRSPRTVPAEVMIFRQLDEISAEMRLVSLSQTGKGRRWKPRAD